MRPAEAARRFDRRAATYDRSASHRWQARRAVEYLSPRPGQRVLDVAAGTGLAAREALAAVGDEGSVVATDVAVAMLRAGRAAAEVPRSSRCRWVGAEAAVLPFPGATFDAMLCVAAVPYFPDPVRALREWRRVCRAHAAAVVTLPPPDGLTVARLLRRAAADEGVLLDDPGGPLGDPRRRPALLRASGWRLERADEVVFEQPLPTPDEAFAFVESGLAEPLRTAAPDVRDRVRRRFGALHDAEDVERHQVLRLRLVAVVS